MRGTLGNLRRSGSFTLFHSTWSRGFASGRVPNASIQSGRNVRIGESFTASTWSTSATTDRSSAAPTPPNGTMVALTLAASRTNSLLSGHRSAYGSPERGIVSFSPPGNRSTLSPETNSLKAFLELTGTAPNFLKMLSVVSSSELGMPGMERATEPSCPNSTGCASPRISTPRCIRISPTRRPMSSASAWWLPTKSNGFVTSSWRGRPPSPRTTRRVSGSVEK
mmetsp:Transcript_28048/g.56500  ORF Transcript_28048/g.56500 Transcript_28048/m.56500 type:complete len:223 (-) Transcript_28048:67-735(-)